VLFATATVVVLAAGVTAGLRAAAPATGAWVVATGGLPSASTPATTGPVTPSPSPSASLRPTPVSVAIFGDSQGRALYATRPSSVSRYLRLSDQSISACGVLRGQVVSRSGERFDLIGACPNWLSAWRTKAAHAKADIALVIVGAWDVFDLRTEHGTLVFGTPQWDANFLATLGSGLAAIRQSGSQIALAELPCYRPRKSNPRPPGWWPERGEDDRTRHVNQLLGQLADGVHIFTVRSAPAFCSDPSIGDNHRYRYDGVHYLQPGSTVYLNAMIPQLLTLPA
jgi:SGNH domain-containing protein